MSDFLLELRSEEIPARMQVKAKEDLARLFAEEIAKSGLVAEGIEAFATPRRLALIARGLPAETAAVSEERKGPRANAPEQALAGFLRSTGLTREQLVERDGVFFAVIDKPGRPTAEVLSEAVPAVIRAFPWPKSMRWGTASASTESLRWVRPLQGIVAILGEDVVPFAFEGIESGAATLGHRFHHPGVITIGGAHDYVEKLRACHVIVHLSERTANIRDGAKKLASDAGLTLVEDEGLVVENAGLTEWPVPLLGSFDPAFLAVPQEVIQLTARINQKYFVLRDSAGKLAPNFVCTANIDAHDGGKAIVAGNERVLSARLSDAKFFWENDLKVALDAQAKKLSQIVFHEKLGTVADKVERVAKLARWLVEEGIVTSSPSPLRGEGRGEGASEASTRDSGALLTAPLPNPLPGGERELADLAERAARLAKADLVTGMVGEFPELQGIIGGHLARAQGEPDAVADAIRDHYKPVGQGDDIPTDPVTMAVSLADKLDTLYCFFARDMKPTGSKDPFALRRAALGCLETISQENLAIPISNLVQICTEIRSVQLLELAFERDASLMRIFDGLAESSDDESFVEQLLRKVGEFGDLNGVKVKLDVDEQAFKWAYEAVVMIHRKKRFAMEILEFLADRLKVQQREAGVRHDLIDAVFALGGEDDLVRLLARVKALQAFVTTPDGTNLLAGYKRASNILKKENVTAAEQKPLSYTPETSEAALIAALDAAEPRAAAAVEAEDFEGAMTALAALRAPIDAFFETVTINDPDADKRAARLALLLRVRDAVHRVADFSKIEG
ncbi:MAG: glycine--tRNA ligase subunit beta [Pseudomonadota bacterium]